MTNSELSEFYNDILIHLRDSEGSSNILWIMMNVSKNKKIKDDLDFEMAIHKLLKEDYILSVEKEPATTNSYYISGDGIVFINNGGYDIKNTNESKSIIIEVEPKSTIKHSTHDPNLWSVKSYELFKYLFENYYSGKNTELMNIWFFIKSDIGKDYLPKPPKALYLKMILDTYNIKITNFDRPTNWFEKHLPIFKGHLILFEQNR